MKRQMSDLVLEKYDPSTETFTPSDVQVVTWDLLGENGLSVPEDSSVFVVATMYDVPRTMIAALRNLRRRYNNPYVAVFNSVKALEEITEAVPGVNLIAVSQFVPNEIKDKPAWQVNFTRQALAAGCAGAIISSPSMSKESCCRFISLHPNAAAPTSARWRSACCGCWRNWRNTGSATAI